MERKVANIDESDASRNTLTPIEVAHILRIAKNTVYELVKRGELPAYRAGKMMRFNAKDVEAYQKGVRAPQSGGNQALAETSSYGQASGAETAFVQSAIPQSSSAPGDGFFLCGQDILLDILGHFLETRIEGLRLRRSYLGSYNGLHELYLGNVQVASSHLWDAATDSYTLPFLPHLLPGIPLTVIRLAKRTVGFYVRNGNPHRLSSWADLGRPDITFVNREAGSGIRVLVDGKLRANGLLSASVPGYGRICTTHLVAATTVARGGGDYAIGSEMTARQVSGISFIPLQEECYDLVFRTSIADSPVVSCLVERIGSPDFLQEIEALGGYVTSETGKVMRC
jgi:putative molybdopterin biosynthesis protein